MKRYKLYVLMILAAVLITIGCSNTDAGKSNSAVDKEAANIKSEEAVAIVANKIENLQEGYHLNFDHKESRDGKEYLVVHYYEKVVDDPKTGEGHTATVAWYYVDKKTEQVYRLDIASNELRLIDE